MIVIEKEDDEETAKNLEILGFKIYTWDEVYEKGKQEGQNLELKSLVQMIFQLLIILVGPLVYQKV